MSMRWYVVRRLMWTVIASWLILSITFGLLEISPNTGEMQAAFEAATQGNDPEAAQEAYRERRGLDRPVWERYTDYVVNMYTGQWGWSHTRSQTVKAALFQAWPYSAQYFIPASVIAAFVGYSIGLYSAMNQYTPADYVGAFVAFFGISIPNFWFAIMLVLVGSVWLLDQTVFGMSLAPLAPPAYYKTEIVNQQGWLSLDNIHQLIFPMIVVSTASVAAQMRYSRAQALEQKNQEYVKTALAKGASGWRVTVRHIFRVAMVPLATILVSDVLALLFGGALFAEIVFQVPGIGLLGYKAIIQQDTPLVMATVLIPVFIAVIGNLLQDLAYVALDPRIDYGDR